MDRDTTRFSSIMAVFAGLSMFAGALSYMFWPEALIYFHVQYYSMVSQNAGLLWFTCLAFALSALASLAVVLATRDLLHAADRGLLRWAAALALVGFAWMAINFVYMATASVSRAYQFEALHERYEGWGIFMEQDAQGQVLLAPIEGSPAETAGIRKGDSLQKIDGRPVAPGAQISELLDTMAQAATAGRMTLTVTAADGASREVAMTPGQVTIWDVSAQRALLAAGMPNLDSRYLFSFGLPGLWLLVLNASMLRRKQLPQALCLLGMFAGGCYWLFILGFLVPGTALLNTVGQIGGMTLGPAWFIWMGLRFSGAGQPQAAASAPLEPAEDGAGF